MSKRIEDKYVRLRQGGHDCQCHVGYLVGSACVRLPLTLGGLGGIILHGEGAGGSWIVLSCAYQQTKA
jgi:hypothetical protein